MSVEVLQNPGEGLDRLGKLNLGQEQHGLLAFYQKAKAWFETQDHKDIGPTNAVGQGAEAVEHSIQGCDSATQESILLYIARLQLQLERQAAGTCGLPLSTIAAATGSNLFDVFREWPVVSAKCAPYLEQQGLSVKQLEALGSISEWQKSLVAVALLSKKYKDLFSRFLHTLPEHKAVVLKLGWLLYLVLKVKLLPRFPDLVSCMEVLVCVMNLLVAHLEKLPEEMKPGADAAINTLDIISDALKTDRQHVHQHMLSVNALFTQQLQGQGKACQEQWQGQPHVHTSCSFLPGLLSDPKHMTHLSSMLENEYRAHFQRHGEIDEVDMLFMDFARFASPRMTPGSVYKQSPFTMPGGSELAGAGAGAGASPRLPLQHKPWQGVSGPQALPGQRLGPGSFVSSPSIAAMAAAANPAVAAALQQGLPTGAHSPLAIAQLGQSTATPISEALGSATWLRNVTAGLKPEPSAALQKYFSACVPNPGATIAQRVKEMTEAVLPCDAQPQTAFPMVQPSILPFRREEAMKLYYHVLELVMVSEERVAAAAGRATQPCYTTLLTSSKLHKGLMACSLEVVMACYKMVSCPFPKVLEIIKLHAFDLIKIVQTYVRHMPGMPLELKRHLYLMEEKTVECLAWQAGSSLFPLIITAMGNTGATSSCTHTAAPPGHPAATLGAANSADTAQVPCSSSSTTSATTHPSSNSQSVPGTQPDESSNPSSDSSCQVHVPLTSPASVTQPSEGTPVPAYARPPSPKRPADAVHSMMSPLKKARGSDSHAITTQPAPQLVEPLPPAVGRPPAAAALAAMHPETAAALTWLHDFLRKVLKLAWFRLGFLCQSLRFGQHDPAMVRQKVYDTVEHALYMHTNLLYNRHLDQLLLSALYGYCKVQHLGDITFKEIINQYRRQPQATQAVFRSVVLAQTNPGLQVQSRGDIIAYYNQAFVPLMKQFLLRGDAAGQPGMGLPPIPPSQPTRATMSPRLGPLHVGAQGAVASPRLFQPAASPLGSPSGRPPLPPQPCDALAVHSAIKQTISGFFPAMPRAAPRNLPPLSCSGRQSPDPGPAQGLVGKLGAAPKGPPPRWGAGASNLAPPSASAPQPLQPAPAPGVPIPPEQMPSGIATLLRALDTANGVAMEEEDGKEHGQEEGGVQAPPQAQPWRLSVDRRGS